MVIQFDNRELRASCEDYAIATDTYSHHADFVLAGVADLVAAPTLGDIPSMLLELVDQEKHLYRLNYGSSSICFQVNHKRPPIGHDDTLDLTRVTRVKIIEVNTHAA